MYNHYIPDANGTFQRKIVDDRAPPRPAQEAPRQIPVCPPEPEEAAATPSCPAAPPCPDPGKEHFLRRLLPRGTDLGDILMLLIVLLLLIDSDEDDTLTVLVTIAAFLLL